MEPSASTSAFAAHPAPPVRSRVLSHPCQCHDSAHSSPRSAALPSPPDSPALDPYADADVDADADSLSSFPSVSSSFFFSSGAASPHSHPLSSGAASRPHSARLYHLHLHEHDHYLDHHDELDHELGHEHGGDAGLIIPSLVLPSALPQPTAFGQTLGEAAFLLVGPAGIGIASLAEFLADADDVLDTGTWEPVAGGGARVLRASTAWIEECDRHGLERFEGAANVSFLALDGFDAAEKPEVVVQKVLQHIHDVFRDVRSQLDNAPSSPLLHSLLASSHSTLYTALIYVTATPLTPQDHAIISGLASSIPIVPFSTTSSSTALSFARHSSIQPKLSAFQPHSHPALRLGLFRSPQTLAALRIEAADRFMRWREVERAVADIASISDDGVAARRRNTITADERWSKAAWEASLSEDIARRMQAERSLPSMSESEKLLKAGLEDSTLFGSARPCFAPMLDPLHLRSLMMFSFALLGPRTSTESSNRKGLGAMSEAEGAPTLRPVPSPTSGVGKGAGARNGNSWRAWRWGLAIMGVFCAGVGIGLALST